MPLTGGSATTGVTIGLSGKSAPGPSNKSKLARCFARIIGQRRAMCHGDAGILGNQSLLLSASCIYALSLQGSTPTSATTSNNLRSRRIAALMNVVHQHKITCFSQLRINEVLSIGRQAEVHKHRLRD